MKSKLILTGLVVSVGVLFLSAGSLLSTEESKEEDGLMNTRINVALRSIGHELMLQTGDFSSRVLPVKQIDRSTFQLKFRGSFTFTPDSLVKITQQKLKEINLSSHYLVSVLDCVNPKQIIYGYEFLEKQNVTIPCLGRVQPVGCYVIQIMFLDDQKTTTSSKNYWWLFSLSMMALVGFVGGRYINKEKSLPAVATEEHLMIGKFTFYYQRRILKDQNNSIDLSDKECHILKILASHQNEVVERDRLLKEVWEDEGVFVGRSLDVFISKLRKKLQADASIRIVNIHGKGYKLETNINEG